MSQGAQKCFFQLPATQESQEEEIHQNDLKTLKLGKFTSPDGLSPEPIVYGGELLKKIINCIVSFEVYS